MKYETSDIATAAFLLMRGLRLISASNPSGKYSFVFDDSDGKAQDLTLEFINSECSKFDSHLRSLRSMLRSAKK